MTVREPSRFAGLSALQAWLVLGLLTLIVVWFRIGADSPSSVPITARPGQTTDVQLYRAIIQRVHDGQNYYQAVGTELRARGYPVRPFVNWRQPTYALLLAHLPSMAYASRLLIVIAAGITVLCWRAFGLRTAGGAATMLVSASVPNALLFQELWASFFIALGLCLYAFDRWRLAMASLLLALAFRELALLPCLVALALAVRERRRTEVIAWVVALAVYGGLLLLHATVVARHYLPDDIRRSWVALGGSGFLISSAGFTPFFTLLPKRVVAVLLPLALFGLAGWRGRVGTRMALTMAAYSAAFSLFGLRCNHYWGIVYAPLLSLGLVRAPGCLRDLFRSLVTPAPAITVVPSSAPRDRG